MSRRFALITAACAGSALAISGSAFGQYNTGFEVSDGITASPGGTSLTGQDGYYTPSGIDYWAMTYAGNAFGIAANPQGGDQFAVGQGQGSPNFSRGQRDITWPSGNAKVEYDVANVFIGSPPASQNLGSFSVQPYPGSADYIHLFTYVDVNTPTAWAAGYLAYNSGGVQYASPGFLPGPEWNNLTMNHWYHFETTIDFTANQIVEVSITDLTTNVTTTVQPTDLWLEGGSTGGLPHPTGFRMFSGGGQAGNVVAFDNMEVTDAGGGAYTCTVTGDCPGTVNVAWANAEPSKPQYIIFAGNTGGVTIPSGPCQGTVLGLGSRNIRLVNTINTGSGSGSVNGAANSGACGGFLQLVTVSNPCAASTVGQIP